ncbi:MFS transporter [Chungangia koreensis]|uniref:MFS transporter n=1 Tax=Chungangia koreensis TaxID=752657 RepID=A0ABV8X4X5_9LACT
MTTKKKLHFAWLVLIGLCITVGLGKAGLNNTAGLFISPVAHDLGVGVGNLTLYLSISAIITMIFLPIGGRILGKYDARIVLIVAILLQAGAYALFGFMNSVWGWYVLAIPLAVGGVFITVLAGPVMVERWFKKRNGMALGIMTAVGGLLGVLAQPVAGNLIANLGWRHSYTILGVAVIIIVIPTILFLIRNNPKDKGLAPYGIDAAQSDEKHGMDLMQGIAFKDASKSAAFILLALFLFIVTSVASFAIHIPTYLVNLGYDVKFAGNAMAALSVGVFVGSLTFGYLTDRSGAKMTAVIAMIIGFIGVSLLLLFASSTAMIITGLILFGFVSTSIGTVGPAMTSALFGSLEYSQIFSTASLGLAVASIIALPAYGYVFDFLGSYIPAMITILVLLVLNIFFVLLAFANKEKLVKSGKWQQQSK